MHNLRSSTAGCGHVPAHLPVPRTSACEDCGSTFKLRMCATCAFVGCCESQAGHNSSHALAAGHPVILSIPVANGFTWCYDHNAYVG